MDFVIWNLSGKCDVSHASVSCCWWAGSIVAVAPASSVVAAASRRAETGTNCELRLGFAYLVLDRVSPSQRLEKTFDY